MRTVTLLRSRASLIEIINKLMNILSDINLFYLSNWVRIPRKRVRLLTRTIKNGKPRKDNRRNSSFVKKTMTVLNN